MAGYHLTKNQAAIAAMQTFMDAPPNAGFIAFLTRGMPANDGPSHLSPAEELTEGNAHMKAFLAVAEAYQKQADHEAEEKRLADKEAAAKKEHEEMRALMLKALYDPKTPAASRERVAQLLDVHVEFDRTKKKKTRVIVFKRDRTGKPVPATRRVVIVRTGCEQHAPL